jgi:hypothetical protein
MRLTCPNHVSIRVKNMCPDQDFLPGLLFSVQVRESLAHIVSFVGMPLDLKAVTSL